MEEDAFARTGPDRLERFLTSWYGPATEPELEPDLALEAPKALRDGIRTLLRWPQSVSVNCLLDAEGSALDRDRLIMVAENQGAWLWSCGVSGSALSGGTPPYGSLAMSLDRTGTGGPSDLAAGAAGRRPAGVPAHHPAHDPTRPSVDDPPVYERPNVDGSRWQPVGEDVSGFLFHLALVEAVWGAPHPLTASGLSSLELAQALAGFSPVPVRPWRWPGPRHRLWAKADLLAFSCVEADPPGNERDPLVAAEQDTVDLARDRDDTQLQRWLVVAARTESARDAMWRRPINWDD